MSDKFITLSWEFIKDDRTTMQEKLILCEIQNLTMLEYGCVANNEHFASLMGIQKEAVSRLINSLVKKGFISSKIKNGSRNFSRCLTINKMLFDPKQNVISPLTKCLETKDNILIKNKTNENYVNHHLYMLLDDKEKEAYNEYISLRKILKLSTTMGIHNRLLEKYFKFGRNIEVITRAINSNWKDFYEIKDFKSKTTLQDLPMEERIIEAERIRQEKIEATLEREYGL